MSLIIKNLHAAIDGNPILKGLSLEIPAGEVHAIMGPMGLGNLLFPRLLRVMMTMKSLRAQSQWMERTSSNWK